ncbi:MAG TPA: polyribonucleotide nucleotidyltransferase [Candidatus Merdicola faecigallinarum]|uniref:Polyribonucleotide nucleotidyltransferase n=1 Tax=Candidatus Merdicola faecigallinarum TaxID=2840862 RepID=A0A9D1SA33_9FIRM|nr:polyribonucleotide nucleotidyltransferase [Candidatus Merdicola faecigallinarum]
MFKTYSMELAGRTLTFETGKMAELANGSVLVRYGDTAVIVNVTASKEPREGIDFFPLSVDYEEKLYAVGKIPGSFQKREGKPSEKAILTSRAIDRPLRPLFPKDFRNDVCVVATALSVDQDNSPEVCAMIGASAALSISDIPFGGPTAAVNVGYVDDQIIINPNAEQRDKSRLNLTVAGTREKIAMIEAGADEIPNDIMLEAIKQAHTEIKKVCDFIEMVQKEIGKPKFEYLSFAVDPDVYNEIEQNFKERMYQDVQAQEKEVRDANMDKLTEDIIAYYTEKHGEEETEKAMYHITTSIHDLEKKCVREMIYKEHKRPDGRKIDEIRPLSCEVGLLPRVHGSALFTRGQTQVLSVATLGMISEEQTLDGIDEEESKRYMHHYNFPAYSVGEARPTRGPGRREIGHGALAEKALVPVIPSVEDFPYAIRVVSEVLSSNGSTSQASICGSTLALMDAGVPIKKPVAGISTGLVTDPDGSDDYIMLTDIQGIEDFFGDMDFKVGGTKDGITAIQVDIKIDGLTYDIIKEAFERTKVARDYILDEIMLKQISEPRKEVSKYAPRIVNTTISVDKIKDVIGPGGKMINKIIGETGVKIDIEEDGKVFIYSSDMEAAKKALTMIEEIAREIEVNQIYEGTVVRILNFGAFVDIGGGKEGLLHISKISKERVNKVEDVLQIGDRVKVKVIEIDDQDRINLSMKDVEDEKEEEA